MSNEELRPLKHFDQQKFSPPDDEMPTKHESFSWIDEKFQLTERGSSIRQEFRAGVVTFVTTAYILVVNAEILTASGPGAHGKLMPFQAVLTATGLTAAFGSFLAGWFGNVPFALSPGMGLNSYFAYGVCRHLGLTWQLALTCCIMQGLLLLLLTLGGACEVVQRFAPPAVKKGITVGLGLFQALIGFEMMKLVVPGEHVLLAMGPLEPRLIISLISLLLVSILLVLRVKASILIGIAFVTISTWILHLEPLPRQLIEVPSLQGVVGEVDLMGFFHHYKETFPVTFMLLFVTLLDIAGIQTAAGEQAGIMENGQLPGGFATFAAASISTIFGGCIGTSSVIVVNESCAGIQDGARTGLSAIVVGFLFLLALPFWPILSAVPPCATAAPLIIVGMFMMANVKYIDWESIDEAMPAFMVITVIPLTYSIANGVAFGLIAFAIVKGTLHIVYMIRQNRSGGEYDQEGEPVPVFAPSPRGGQEVFDPSPGHARSPYVASTSQKSRSYQTLLEAT